VPHLRVAGLQCAAVNNSYLSFEFYLLFVLFPDKENVFHILLFFFMAEYVVVNENNNILDEFAALQSLKC
jgi:hypothetical protein